MNIKSTDIALEKVDWSSPRGQKNDSSNDFEQCLLSSNASSPFSRLREKVPEGRMRVSSDGTYSPEKPSSVASRHLLPQAGEGIQYQNYYWHHQNQLQQSALTFNALPSENKASVPIINTEATEEPSMQSIDTPAPDNVKTTAIIITIEAPKRADTAMPSIHLESLIDGIETQVNQPLNVIEPIKIRPVIRDEKATPLQMTLVTSPASFKNYHVFTDDACIELTLNTRTLSSQEASHLQRTIQQWLVQNGYVLKTLIINGVKQ